MEGQEKDHAENTGDVIQHTATVSCPTLPFFVAVLPSSHPYSLKYIGERAFVVISIVSNMCVSLLHVVVVARCCRRRMTAIPFI